MLREDFILSWFYLIILKFLKLINYAEFMAILKGTILKISLFLNNRNDHNILIQTF